MPIVLQIVWLLILSIPVACVAWTVTHEEVFREPRDYCQKQAKSGKNGPRRKFFYLFTCEYCFSHYVTAGFLILTRYKLLFPDWRGYVISLFSLVFVANLYMTIFARIRLEVRKERIEITSEEASLAEPKRVA